MNVDTLEHLMTMVSELVLTRNQLLEIARRHEDSSYKVPLQRLSHVTAELQEGVMKTRMQPIGNAWQKLPRVVRDLSAELGKQIDLVMVGAETELDRQVLEVIKDPLTHMVRNSADHGLESTADRVAAGKPARGTIRLAAYHEGGTITIEIADDGKGLNLAAIRKKAVERGLASQADVDRMTDAQVAKFIFDAGFSTAAAVTSVSGRGVGMDVVKTNIETIGGLIDIATTAGRGHHLHHQDPADAGHRGGADRARRRAPLRPAAGGGAGIGAGRCRGPAGRADQRRAGAAPARAAAADRVAHRPARAGEPRARRPSRRASWWSPRSGASASASWSTRSSTRRRSS